MKILNLLLLLLLLLTTAEAQSGLIGTIDFYGGRTVSEEKVRRALQIKEGDNVPESKEAVEKIEKRLAALPNVAQARVSAVCCAANGRLMIYVGVREKNSPILEFRAAPKGTIRLTENIFKTGSEYAEAHHQAVLKGDAAEDRSDGHSLVKNPEARSIQEKFIPLANRNLNLLRRVLRESSDAEHRALAAQVIAYYKDKSVIVADLIEAMKDENSTVRNNAMRSLGLIAMHAQLHPGKRIKVPFEPFVALLNSLEWTDRNKSALALEELTVTRNAELLKLLRETSVPALIEMARWKNDGHAGTSFFILGRVGNFSDDEIGQAWLNGMREDLIAKAQKNFQK